MTRRHALYLSLIAVVLLIAIAWSYSCLSTARDAAASAAADLQSCRAMSTRIDTLHHLLAGGSNPLDQTDLQRRGQEALQSVGLSGDHLLQIAPDQPQTIGQSAYKEFPTELSLRDMNLRQTVGFFLAIEGENSLLQVKNLRLFDPHDTDSGARWSVEATLSHFIYEPRGQVSPVRTLEKD